jgi:transcriptional regulator with XRE-family HTH domain
MSYFSQNLKFLRQKRGETQYTIAPFLDIKRTNYANYEQGVAEPSIKLLLTIANYFNISVDDLISKELDDSNYIEEQKNVSIYDNSGNLLLPVEMQRNYTKQIHLLKKVFVPEIQGNARTIEVADDGMYGNIEEGDFVACIPCTLSDLRDSVIYAIILEDKVTVRRVKLRKDSLLLIPYNKSYATEMIQLNEIKEIWEAKIRLTKSFSNTI